MSVETLRDRTPPSITSRPRVIQQCVICGSNFAIAPKVAARYTTCSDDCSSIRKAKAKRVHPETGTCEACGSPFRNEWGARHRFCSNECRLQALNQLPRARREGEFLSPHLTPKGYVWGQVWRDGKIVPIAEHRWVMEQHLGRRLEAAERVHHVNGQRADNRIENLRLFASQAQHLRECHTHSAHDR